MSTGQCIFKDLLIIFGASFLIVSAPWIIAGKFPLFLLIINTFFYCVFIVPLHVTFVRIFKIEWLFSLSMIACLALWMMWDIDGAPFTYFALFYAGLCSYKLIKTKQAVHENP